MIDTLIGRLSFGPEIVNESLMYPVTRDEVIALRKRVKELESELTQLKLRLEKANGD
jgi:hypothetical protein